MQKLRTVAVFPTMFTLGNLICGFFAIVVASRVGAATPNPIPKSRQLELRNPAELVAELDPADQTHNIVFSGWLIFLAMILGKGSPFIHARATDASRLLKPFEADLP